MYYTESDINKVLNELYDMNYFNTISRESNHFKFCKKLFNILDDEHSDSLTKLCYYSNVRAVTEKILRETIDDKSILSHSFQNLYNCADDVIYESFVNHEIDIVRYYICSELDILKDYLNDDLPTQFCIDVQMPSLEEHLINHAKDNADYFYTYKLDKYSSSDKDRAYDIFYRLCRQEREDERTYKKSA